MSVNVLEVFVEDITAVLDSFDVIKVAKALASTGPWTEITAAAATHAGMIGTTTSPFVVSGLTLLLLVDNQDESTVTFTGTNPLTVAQVNAQINDVVADLASADYGRVKLTSATTGSQSKVRVSGGTALTLLGFTLDQKSTGKEPYVTLVLGQNSYSFTDRDGTDEDYYEVSYFNTSNLLQSSWSEPFQAEPGTAIDSSHLSVASVNLIDIRGVSVSGQEITVFPLDEPLLVQAHHVGLASGPITVTTDNSGHAEITLVRGLKVKVSIQGSLVREITIPDTATFDLLELMAAAPDPYNPVAPNYPTAPRRTL